MTPGRANFGLDNNNTSSLQLEKPEKQRRNLEPPWHSIVCADPTNRRERNLLSFPAAFSLQVSHLLKVSNQPPNNIIPESQRRDQLELRELHWPPSRRHRSCSHQPMNFHRLVHKYNNRRSSAIVKREEWLSHASPAYHRLQQEQPVRPILHRPTHTPLSDKDDGSANAAPRCTSSCANWG